MLENEPDTNDQAANPEAASTQESSTPPPRRRRAASRPAGPPAAAPEAPAIAVNTPAAEQTAAEQPAEPAEKKPAKKTAAKRTRKTPAKKTTSAPPAETPAAEVPSEAPAGEEPAAEAPAAEAPAAEAAPTKTPRKRATRKTAAAKKSAAVPTDTPPVESISGENDSTPAPQATAESATAPESATAAESATAPESDSTTEAESEPAPAKKTTRRRTRRPVTDPFAVPDIDTSPAPAADAGAEPAVKEVEPAEQVADETTAAAPVSTPAAASDDSASDDSDSDDSDSDDSDSDDSDSNSDDSDGQPRRRRRRRGGRRRRRGGSDDQSGDDPSSNDRSDDDDQGSESKGRSNKGSDKEGDSDQDASDDDNDDVDRSEGDGQRRRRRRRRRRGEDAGSAPDDPSDVVVRVREPRGRKNAQQQVTGIEGSTRMEAKRQRRRDGREAGRRRAPILSEAEFLARRESVNRKMVIRQREDLSQIAVLEDGVLVEHYVDRDSAASLIGNVYLGRVQNVLPSMEAAFIDIGRGRNAVLYAGEVDWESFGAEGQNRKVEKVLKSGQTVLVQVSKDPVGAKGARLTNHVSIPGRYIVYAPGGHLSGISRKLPDTERKRLKDILADLVGEQASVIVRTAAEGASEDELVRDVNRLKAQWEDIEGKVKAGQAPQLLYGEPDLTVRIVRDLFTEDFSELIIQGNGSMNDAHESIEGYVTHVAPHLKERLKRWDTDNDGDLFSAHRLDEQIAKGLERKVFLPSGGSLIIDRTEAMTVIDVNTGKFTGAGGNLEATVTSNNLEAAEEIVNQLRLRDIGGIIVIDFIDMVLPANRELLLRRLVECLGRDRTRHQVAEVTSLGLVQMTRKKIGTGLLEAFSVECEHCQGRGVELHDVPVETQAQADGGTRDSGRGRSRGGRSGGGRSGGRSGGGSNGNGSNGQDSGGQEDSAKQDSGKQDSADDSGSTSTRSRRSRRGGRSDRSESSSANAEPVGSDAG